MLHACEYCIVQIPAVHGGERGLRVSGTISPTLALPLIRFLVDCASTLGHADRLQMDGQCRGGNGEEGPHCWADIRSI